MPKRALIPPTRQRPRIRINPKPQAHRMHAIRNGGHPVRKTRQVGLEVPRGVAPGGPTVVLDDVVVPGVPQPEGDDEFA